MFYDLNIPWPQVLGAGSGSSVNAASQPSKKKAKQQQPIPQSFASSSPPATPETPSTPLSSLREKEATILGQIALELNELRYSYVAFNHIVHSKYDPVVHQNSLVPSRDGRPNPPFPQLDPRTCLKGKVKANSIGDGTGLMQLSRLTLVLDDQSMAKSGTGWVTNNASALQSYDLLAVRPTTEAAFQHACLTLSDLKPFSIDIISLDFGAQSRLPFFLKRSTVHAALENGVQFEITYSQAVSDDGTKARRNLISGARDLLRVTNGKGIFFSSGATEALSLRAPFDVINLGAIFGLNQSAARDAISNNCRSLVLRSQTRKTYRGVVSHPVVLLPGPNKAAIGAVFVGSGAQSADPGSFDSIGKKRKALQNDGSLAPSPIEVARSKNKKPRT
ncbi:related to Ribonuclease P protein subunit p30 [Melanopsichium pennsylvanicum]|uniref:Related to Ribonuclease P protein subunit p30 n=2 Tax=Melanopsichium pennsylvanicum TaxID=63383 RepID=A0AAJ4XNN8_9BASI|nr:related to Ribonuclease P protein subunit p30 [Melanopsichium pennsylvanicum 4]SNX85121.1 related to Ribonuclease P protein subunit p30 [Melanopsichium pennsylvanicum]